MNRSELDRLPIGALLLQPKSGKLMVVTANNREEVSVTQLGFSDAYLPPSLHPRTLEYRVPKPLLGKRWQVTRIA